MANDDYFVMLYKILAYLEDVLKGKIELDYRMFEPYSVLLPVHQEYRDYVLLNACKNGFIDGVVEVPILGADKPQIKITPTLSITPKGIEYLQDNSKMQAIKKGLLNVAKITPVVGTICDIATKL